MCDLTSDMTGIALKFHQLGSPTRVRAEGTPCPLHTRRAHSQPRTHTARARRPLGRGRAEPHTASCPSSLMHRSLDPSRPGRTGLDMQWKESVDGSMDRPTQGCWAARPARDRPNERIENAKKKKIETAHMEGSEGEGDIGTPRLRSRPMWCVGVCVYVPFLAPGVGRPLFKWHVKRESRSAPVCLCLCMFIFFFFSFHLALLSFPAGRAAKAPHRRLARLAFSVLSFCMCACAGI